MDYDNKNHDKLQNMPTSGQIMKKSTYGNLTNNFKKFEDDSPVSATQDQLAKVSRLRTNTDFVQSEDARADHHGHEDNTQKYSEVANSNDTFPV